MDQPRKEPTQNQIQIKASDETLKGLYSNMVNIHHTKEEFVLDFMNVFPPRGILSARMIVSPSHMKRMISALAENIAKYEAHFGKVEASEEPKNTIGFQAKDE
jgi:hypothetical protein